MNGTGSSKRRSARLSQEGGENEPPAKKSRVNGATTHTTVTTTTEAVSTKQDDGDTSKAGGRRKAKVYEQEIDDFAFTKGKRKRATKATRDATNTEAATQDPPAAAAPRTDSKTPAPDPIIAQATAPADIVSEAKTKRKSRAKLPESPDKGAVEKPVRRSKRLSDDANDKPQASPHRPTHTRSHQKADRSPTPELARPVTVEKKRKQGVNGGAVVEEKVMRIVLPFADTPIVRRNREMRKKGAENQRRSSSGMRGRRASSMIDEGRGHALPHAEVETTDFYKHISEDLTEPRRMRCLLGWCGSRALPAKPDPPPDKDDAAIDLDSQALRIARTIQEQLSQDLITKGSLSDWFSRDESVPIELPRKKKANPRNIANAAKAEELERELERLKIETAEWDSILASVPAEPDPSDDQHILGQLSPLRPDFLDTPQRAILELLNPPQLTRQADSTSTTANDPASAAATSTSAIPSSTLSFDPAAIHTRLHHLSANLEFTVDQFAHGVHALRTARDTAERLAEKSLSDAATALEDRERARAARDGTPAATDPLNALKGLAKVLNAGTRK